MRAAKELENYLTFAKAAVLQAAKAISSTARVKVAYKRARDLVTNADLASEQVLIDLIRANFPGHGIVAEERGAIGANDYDWRWVLDPLDGTTNFSRGYPDWTVSLALTYRWEPLVGVIYSVSSNQLFSAVRGGGACLNEAQIAVSATASLKGALVATGFPYSCPQPQPLFDRLRDVFLAGVNDIKRKGPSSAEAAMVACGTLDAYFENDLKPWDVAASMLIAAEAGGRVSDWRGQALDLSREPIDIVISNGRVHQQLLEIIQRY